MQLEKKWEEFFLNRKKEKNIILKEFSSWSIWNVIGVKTDIC